MKRKALLSLLLIALFAPLALNAQVPVPVPYIEGFENMNFAADLTTAGWLYLGPPNGSIDIDTSHPNAYGTKALNINAWTCSSGDSVFAVLPQLNVPINTLQIRFDYLQRTGGTVKVGYLTNPNPTDASTFVAIEVLPSSTIGWSAVTVDLSSVPSTAARIAIEQYNYYECYIDEIVVSCCHTPQHLEALLTPCDPTTVILSWESPSISTGGIEFEWELQYDTDSTFANGNNIMCSTSPVALNGLFPDTTYYARVRAHCIGEEWSEWNKITFRTSLACPVPTNLTAILTPCNGTIATLGWTAGCDETDWVLQYGMDSTFAANTYIADTIGLNADTTGLIISGTAISKNLTSLIPNTTYYTRVKADCGGGDESSWSAFCTFHTEEACPAPKALTAILTPCNGTTVTLNWTAGCAETEWVLQYDTNNTFANCINIICNTTPFAVTGLTPQTTYYARVKARCSNYEESVWSNICIFQTGPACPQPTALNASLTPGNGTIATLNWTMGCAETKWVLQYGMDSTFATYIADTTGFTTSGTTVSKNLTGLTPDSTYYARVKAVCSVGDESAWSNVCTFTPTNNSPSSVVNNGTFPVACAPLCGNCKSSYCQMIYTASQLQGRGINGPCSISKIDFNSAAANQYTRKPVIYICHAPNGKSSFSSNTDFVSINEFTKVYDYNNHSTWNITEGWNEFTLDTPFEYDGYSNLIIAVHCGMVDDCASTSFYGAPTTNNQVIYAYSDDADPNPAAYEGNWSNYPSSTAVTTSLLSMMICYESVSCHAPTALNASLTPGNGTIATLSWTAGGYETDWVLQYGMDNTFASGTYITDTTGFTTSGTTISKDLTGLTSDSTYYARVKANCGGGDVSAWSTLCTFTPTDDYVVNNGTSTIAYAPLDGYYKSSYCQMIYTASQLHINGPCAITKIGFNSAAVNSRARKPMIYICHAPNGKSSFSNYDDFVSINEFTEVYDYHYHTGWNITSGWNEFTLDTPFEYDGSSNLIIAVYCGLIDEYAPTYFYGAPTTNTQVLYAISDNYDLNPFTYEGNWTGHSGTSLPSLRLYSEPPLTCPPPRYLNAFPGNRFATISWTAGSNEVAWVLQFSENSTFPLSSTITDSLVIANPYLLENLVPETTYYVRLKAKCGIGDESAWSAICTFQTEPACPAPTDLNAIFTPGNGTIATLMWTASGYETDWMLQLSEDSTFAYCDSIFCPESRYTLFGLYPETTYYARVKANCSSDGYSDWSDICTFTPSDAFIVNNGTFTGGYAPLYGYYESSYCQMIYTASQLQDGGIDEPCSITKIGFNSVAANLRARKPVIYVCHAPNGKSSFSNNTDFVSINEFTKVYDYNNHSTWNITEGWNEFTLDTSFEYDGSSNLIIAVHCELINNYAATSFYGAPTTNDQVIYAFSSNTDPNPTTYEGNWNGYSGNKGLTTSLPSVKLYYDPVSCPTPRALNAILTSGNDTIATLRWTAVGTETDWVLQYSTNSTFATYIADTTGLTTDTTGLTISGTTISKSLTGLTSDATYYARVKANCGSGDESAWSNVCTFTPSNTSLSVVNNGTSSIRYAPLYGYYKSSYCQMIYTASQLQGGGINGPCTITKIGFNSASSSGARKPLIYICHAPNGKSSFSDDNDFVSIDEFGEEVYNYYYHTDWNITEGWNEFTLDIPFEYDGSSNLIIAVHCEWINNERATSFYGAPTTNNQVIYAFSDSYTYDPNPFYYEDWSSYSGTTAVTTSLPSLRLYSEPPHSCPPPRYLNVIPGPYHALLSWTGDDYGGWIVEVGTNSNFTDDIMFYGVTNPLVIVSLVPETTYYVRIKADCGDGDESVWSAIYTFQTEVACPAPTALNDSLTPGNGTIATLRWTAGGYEDDWVLQYGTDSNFAAGTYFENTIGLTTDTTGLTVSGTNVSKSLTGLTPDTTYYARVKADCGGGDGYSDWSNICTFTPTNANIVNNGTFTGAYAPLYAYYESSYCQMIYTASQLQDGGINGPCSINKIGFNSVASNQYARKPVIYICHAPNGKSSFNNDDFVSINEFTKVYDYNNHSTWNITPGWNEFTLDTPFEYDGSSNLIIAVHCGLIDNYANTSFYGASTTNNQVIYAYHISIDPDPVTYEGNWSNYPGNNIRVTTFLPSLKLNYDPVSCPTPRNLSAIPGSLSATLSWTAGGAETEWMLQYGTDSNFAPSFTTTDSLCVNNPYSLTNLVPETTYYVRVKAKCGIGYESGWNTCTFQTEPTCPAPTALNDSLTQGNGTIATLSWRAGGTETDWVLQYGTDSTFVAYIADTTGFTVSGTTISKGLTGLAPDTIYYARVKAVCGGGDESVWSNTLTFEPTNKTSIGSGTETVNYLPTFTYYDYSYTQQIYTTAEFGGAGLIESIDFYMTGTSDYTRNLDIYMVSTDKNSFIDDSDWINVTSADLVYSNNVTFLGGTWTTIPLNNSFVYDGVHNVAIIVDDNTSGYESHTFLSYTSRAAQSHYAYQDGTNIDPSAPSAQHSGILGSKNQIRILKTELPDCLPPVALNVTDLMPTCATLHWTSDADDFNVRYRTAAYEEAIFFEGFENGLPSDWTIIDSDGDGYNWFTVSNEVNAHTGTGSMASMSYVSGTDLTPDEWLITPRVQLQGTLKFWVKSQSINYPEKYAVYVSTGTSAISDFEMIGEQRIANFTSYTEIPVDLSSYNGANGYVAIRHYNSDGMYYFRLDDFGIYISHEAGQWKNATAAADSLLITNLYPDKPYEWQVQADCSATGDGESNWSGIANFTTPFTEYYTKTIAGYSNNEGEEGGYYLIASPIGNVDLVNMPQMFENYYDLYYFDQSEDFVEWRNYKKVPFSLETGKGYLYANSEDVTLVFVGAAYDGDGQVQLNKVEGVIWEGWNLVGNPFAQTAYIADPNRNSFYTMNESGSEIILATNTGIGAMEAVFVIAEDDNETLTFTIEEPVDNSKTLTINLVQDDGLIDRAIVRFDEGGLLPKFQLNSNSTKLYVPIDGNDYAVAFSEEVGEMPVNFKAESDGTYTLSYNVKNVEFVYLHLIDNLTGKEVDLLETSIYSFMAKTTDYESRFKLVFVCGDANGENDDFAFFSNGNLFVRNEGEATVQVIDTNGRILSSETINGCANVNVNADSEVYIIRLINGENVKVQTVAVR